MKYLSATIAALALASLSVQAQDKTQEFVEKVSVSNSFEIASSELALERAQSPAVRQFAQHMVEDHGKAAEDLKAAVEKSELGVGVRDTLDDKHAEMMQELGDATGAQFDQKYVEMQMAAHDEAVKLFEQYASHAASEDASSSLRQFAEKTLPVLKQHDRHIEQLSRQVANL
ncbi:MAG TPA: DUF4142 domain-containing protein [Woeseiaceae bacterium]|nr:DUF4142 domain-containing protein [Woeseiaceae bacterium]